jgi:hypothetical protein
MELVLLIAVVWILVLPTTIVASLLCASALVRRRMMTARDYGAIVVPLRPPTGTAGRHVA